MRLFSSMRSKAYIVWGVLTSLLFYWKFCYSLDGLTGLFFGDLLTRVDTTEYASMYSDKGFRKLRIGMSSDEVKSLLGEPLCRWDISSPKGKVLRENFAVENEAWTYSRSPNDSDYRIRVVHFHLGKVSKTISEYWLD